MQKRHSKTPYIRLPKKGAKTKKVGVRAKAQRPKRTTNPRNKLIGWHTLSAPTKKNPDLWSTYVVF